MRAEFAENRYQWQSQLRATWQRKFKLGFKHSVGVASEPGQETAPCHIKRDLYLVCWTKRRCENHQYRLGRAYDRY